jgi:hypothetical protein
MCRKGQADSWLVEYRIFSEKEIKKCSKAHNSDVCNVDCCRGECDGFVRGLGVAAAIVCTMPNYVTDGINHGRLKYG